MDDRSAAQVPCQAGRSWLTVHPDAAAAIGVDGRRQRFGYEADRGRRPNCGAKDLGCAASGLRAVRVRVPPSAPRAAGPNLLIRPKRGTGGGGCQATSLAAERPEVTSVKDMKRATSLIGRS